MFKCRKCGLAVEPSPHEIKKRDFACKPCRSAMNKAYREQRRAAGLRVSGTRMPPEYHAQYGRRHSQLPHVKEKKRLEAAARWRDPAYRPRIEARMAARNALRRGEIIKPAGCESCGSTSKLSMHHADYDKPLGVEWLCLPCHKLADKEAKAKGGA